MASSRAIEVSIPHKLPRAEVRARLDAQLADIARGKGGIPVPGKVEHAWAGDRMNFTARAMGQTATGRLDVLDDAVKVQIDLPWMLAKLAASLGIGKQIEEQGRKLLEAK